MKENYLTVSALTKYLKQKFDRDPYLQQVYLTGEISNFRLRANSHQYFSLKDDGAKISAVMFKGAFNKLKFKPEEGQKVLVIGRITLYEGSGNYQINIEHMEPDGVGALYQALRQLQEKLAKEGLFSAPKKALPHFPKKIAVVTSPSGAVIRDIITTIKRRYPICEITLFPTLVQGTQAALDIAKNINYADSLGFDTMIIGRGGGSIEDLWPFNEEIVARSIFQAKTPIISSVGHETDTTIADLVADLRAPTPTAAAELAVPVLVDELQKLKEKEDRLFYSMQKLLHLKNETFKQIKSSYVLQQPQRLYESLTMKLDYTSQQLIHSFQQFFQEKNKSYEKLNQELLKQNPTPTLMLANQKVQQGEKDLKNAMENLFQTKNNELKETIRAMDLLSPLKILGRGYSYVTKDEKIVKEASDVAMNDEVVIHLKNGQLKGTITEINKGE